ncbi:glycosyltransferase family 2 protein [Gemmatimonadota bacterium]
MNASPPAERVDGLVSVVLPAFNCAEFLGDAIESVVAQRYGPMEVIVVDDGSTDDTPQVIESYEDRIVSRRQANAGVASARNLGLKMAAGEYVAFIDGDDLWPQDKLAIHMAAMGADPELEMTIGLTQLITEGGSQRPVKAFGDPWYSPVFGAMVCRRSVFDGVGLLDEGLRTEEDLDWFVRAREQDVRRQLVDAVSVFYRRQSDSLTSSPTHDGQNLPRIIKHSLDRRRASVERLELSTWFPTERE